MNEVGLFYLVFWHPYTVTAYWFVSHYDSQSPPSYLSVFPVFKLNQDQFIFS